MKRLLAISIRQPYAMLVMLRKKKHEYRSRSTKVTGRVYVYASKRPGERADWKAAGFEYGSLPVGKIIGTVEINGSKQQPGGGYAWRLRSPKKLRTPVAPQGHPQPLWFYPFGRP